ncbi:Aste57867_14220 [Aphanomyces stellatus]|uniref:Aste57867_14220 protein n=1 Tax=Aphanomyces stellatus TaxID=120398 RepID=A0A485L1S7_9STRA|nr:hypothetical protein As57867_014169 [Aphanomyces stellatus]VFT91045.1 Aste57867_14220 [Aphanomyces stellatus]
MRVRVSSATTRRRSEIDDDDIEAHGPLTWQRVVLALISYALFLTDIPRSGYGFHVLPFPQVSTNMYSIFGPYNYRIAKISRDATSSTIVGQDDLGPLTSAAVWSYKFDTTSIGMRAILHRLAPHAWDACFAYAINCPTPSLDLPQVFSMLDTLVDVMARTTAPMMFMVEHHYVDHLQHILVPGVFKERQWRVVQGHVFNLTNSLTNESICHAPTSFTFCYLPWSNFQAFGPGLTSVGHVANHIRAHAESYLLSANQTLVVLVIESTVDDNHDAGGVIDTATKDFDVVTIFRVQTCDSRACHTDILDDYRYEGSMLSTNAPTYYRTLRLLRFVGQVYNSLRLVALFVGCFVVVRHNPSFAASSGLAKLLSTLKLGLRVPCQMVVYGSWFPVLLFVVSHTIDCTMVYSFSNDKWKSILGQMNMSLVDVLWILSCHMRNVWVLSLISKIVLHATHSTESLVHFGIPGVRGYVLAITSCLSVFFNIRLVSLRSTQLVDVALVPPSLHLGLLRTAHGLPYQMSNSGLWLDTKNLFFAGLVVLVILRLRFNHPIFVRAVVPHAVIVYANPLLFSTSWFGAVLDPHTSVTLDGSSRVASVRTMTKSRHAVHVLMNMAWMTDPCLFVHLLWQNPMVYTYEEPDSIVQFDHPLPPKQMQLWKADDSTSYVLVRKQPLLDLPWRRRIHIE